MSTKRMRSGMKMGKKEKERGGEKAGGGTWKKE